MVIAVAVVFLGIVQQAFVFIQTVEDIGHVEKGRLFQSNINKGGLHAGQHPHHTPLVDVAHNPLFPGPLDVEFGNGAVLDQGDPGFLGRHIDDQFRCHGACTSIYKVKIVSSFSMRQSFKVSTGRPVTAAATSTALPRPMTISSILPQELKERTSWRRSNS